MYVEMYMIFILIYLNDDMNSTYTYTILNDTNTYDLSNLKSPKPDYLPE